MDIKKSLDNFDPNVVAVAEEFSSAYAKEVSYILQASDKQKERFINQDATIFIPDATESFKDFICIISLDSPGVVTFEKATGSNPILIFSGGVTYNKLKRTGGSATIRVRSVVTNTWKIEGALEE